MGRPIRREVSPYLARPKKRMSIFEALCWAIIVIGVGAVLARLV